MPDRDACIRNDRNDGTIFSPLRIEVKCMDFFSKLHSIIFR